MYLYMIIGFPIYVFGIVTNFIPYKAPRWVAMKYNSAKSEIASIKLVVGMALFIAYYGLGIYLFNGAVSDYAYTIVYALSLIPAGNFVLSYVRKIRRYREHLRFLTMFYQKTTIVSQIQQERKELIDFINRAKDEYVNINKSQWSSIQAYLLDRMFNPINACFGWSDEFYLLLQNTIHWYVFLACLHWRQR